MLDCDKEKINNSAKIENALLQVKNRKTNIVRDPTIFVDDKGVTFKTNERAVKDVPPPISHIPSDSEVFNDSLIPDYKFLMQHFKGEGRLTEQQLITIIEIASKIMRSEPNMLEVDCPATVVGDIHGQYFDMCKMFDMCGDPSETQYLFMGDYVDRGDCSIEVLVLLYAMKINFPKRFWLLRGNHESARMTEYFTYKRECETKYSNKLYTSSLESFKTLPICAVLNNQFFCVHGGLSKELIKLADIENIDRFKVDFPSRGLFCDLMWSDPSPEYDTENIKDSDYDKYYRYNVERHCSYYVTYPAVCDFLRENNLLSVVRAHQAQDAGYRMYKKNDVTGFPSMITIFSAPNYCHTYKNKAATLVYDGETFNIKQYVSSPAPYYLPDFMDVFEWSLPFVSEKVLDILVAILNICTEDELSQKTLVLGDVSKSLNPVKKEEGAEEVSLSKKPTLALESRTALRKKLLSVGRMSRMFNILREESEKIQQLKSFSGGKLPKGILVDGREELQNKLHSFSEARIADLDNEGLPPSQDELEKISLEKKEKYKKFIDGGSSSDQF